MNDVSYIGHAFSFISVSFELYIDDVVLRISLKLTDVVWERGLNMITA